MSVYQLDQNEAVIMHASNVLCGSSRVDLILTNKNLIQVNKGFFGGDKDSQKYPLKDLKVLNGKANVLIGKSSAGQKQMELYFNGYERKYHFGAMLAENKWSSAIIKAHKQLMDEIEREQKAASGKGNILKSIAGTFDSAKEKVLPKKAPSMKTIKCPKCGAELSGEKGSAVQCPYCNATVVIK